MGLNLTFKTVKGAVFHLDFPPETKVSMLPRGVHAPYDEFSFSRTTKCFRSLQVEEVKRKIEETQGESMPAADLVVISQGKVGICSPTQLYLAPLGNAEKIVSLQILLDETSLADNNITESGFLVVMVKPKVFKSSSALQYSMFGMCLADETSGGREQCICAKAVFLPISTCACRPKRRKLTLLPLLLNLHQQQR